MTSSVLDVSSLRVQGSGSTAHGSNAYVTERILREIVNESGLLDTISMERLGLQSAFSSFNATWMSPADLGVISKNMFALGSIDKVTSMFFISAGTSLDGVGCQTHPSVKMNALDYFAARIDKLRRANLYGNEHAFHVVPDYIKALHTL
ncbi:hypothetical protein D3C71_273310 [compost metagenome]